MENKFTDAKWITDDKQVKDLNKFTNVTIDDGQLKDPKQIFSEL